MRGCGGCMASLRHRLAASYSDLCVCHVSRTTSRRCFFRGFTSARLLSPSPDTLTAASSRSEKLIAKGGVRSLAHGALPNGISALPQNAPTSSPFCKEREKLVLKTFLKDADKETNQTGTNKRTPPRFETFWTEEETKTALDKGVAYEGILRVPAFQTNDAFVVLSPAEAKRLETQRGRRPEKRSRQMGSKMVTEFVIPLTGYRARNRALPGDRVVVVIGKPERRKGVDEELGGREDLTAAETEADIRPGLGVEAEAGGELTGLSVGGKPEAQVECLERRESAESSGDLSLGGPLDHLVRGRVVRIVSRGETLAGPLACTIQPDATEKIAKTLETGGGEVEVLAQPRDSRCPPLRLKVRVPGEVGRAVEVGTRSSPSVGSLSQPESVLAVAALRAAGGGEGESFGALERVQSGGEGAGLGVLCAVRFEDWGETDVCPSGVVEDVMGLEGDMKAEALATLAFHKVEWRAHPADVVEELREKLQRMDKKSGKPKWLADAERDPMRADFRHLDSFTIDPPTAKDLDDAISVELTDPKGKILPKPHDLSALMSADPQDLPPVLLRIGVHIADVGHFVPRGERLDLEAARRASTVYLDGMTFPMLPRDLSESVCSLLPHLDRLSFSVFFHLDLNGRLVVESPDRGTRGRERQPNLLSFVKKGIIRTRARLDYASAEGFLSATGAEGVPVERAAERIQAPPSVARDLALLSQVAERRRQWRLSSGGLSVYADDDATGERLRLDGGGDPSLEAREAPSPLSHHLVEECMVVANHVVAIKLLEGDRQESVLRRHPKTEEAAAKAVLQSLPAELRSELEEKASTLKEGQLHALSCEGSKTEALTSNGAVIPPLSEILDLCRKRLSPSAYGAVSTAALQEFKAAEYFAVAESKAETWEHWALQLPAYMHFTSPIRRYADILVHRTLGASLSQAAAQKGDGEGERDAKVDLKTLEAQCGVCNTKKRAIEDAERSIRSLAFNRLLRSRYGQRGMEYDDAVLVKIISDSDSKGSQGGDHVEEVEEEEQVEERETEGILEGREGSVQGQVGEASEFTEEEEEEESLLRPFPFSNKSKSGALLFFVPLMGAYKSVGFRVLGISVSSLGGDTLKDGHSIEANYVDNRGEAQSVCLRPFAPLRVRLVPGEREWSVRLDIPTASPELTTRAREAPAKGGVGDSSKELHRTEVNALPLRALPHDTPPPPQGRLRGEEDAFRSSSNDKGEEKSEEEEGWNRVQSQMEKRRGRETQPDRDSRARGKGPGKGKAAPVLMAPVPPPLSSSSNSSKPPLSSSPSSASSLSSPKLSSWDRDRDRGGSPLQSRLQKENLEPSRERDRQKQKGRREGGKRGGNLQNQQLHSRTPELCPQATERIDLKLKGRRSLKGPHPSSTETADSDDTNQIDTVVPGHSLFVAEAESDGLDPVGVPSVTSDLKARKCDAMASDRKCDAMASGLDVRFPSESSDEVVETKENERTWNANKKGDDGETGVDAQDKRKRFRLPAFHRDSTLRFCAPPMRSSF